MDAAILFSAERRQLRGDDAATPPPSSSSSVSSSSSSLRPAAGSGLLYRRCAHGSGTSRSSSTIVRNVGPLGGSSDVFSDVGSPMGAAATRSLSSDDEDPTDELSGAHGLAWAGGASWVIRSGQCSGLGGDAVGALISAPHRHLARDSTQSSVPNHARPDGLARLAPDKRRALAMRQSRGLDGHTAAVGGCQRAVLSRAAEDRWKQDLLHRAGLFCS
eukprot:COSAG01_NODE_11074_length_2012_cov_16.857292_2_plen_217_part_00